MLWMSFEKSPISSSNELRAGDVPNGRGGGSFLRRTRAMAEGLTEQTRADDD
jgi:hypothetical protein